MSFQMHAYMMSMMMLMSITIVVLTKSKFGVLPSRSNKRQSITKVIAVS